MVDAIKKPADVMARWRRRVETYCSKDPFVQAVLIDEPVTVQIDSDQLAAHETGWVSSEPITVEAAAGDYIVILPSDEIQVWDADAFEATFELKHPPAGGKKYGGDQYRIPEDDTRPAVTLPLANGTSVRRIYVADDSKRAVVGHRIVSDRHGREVAGVKAYPAADIELLLEGDMTVAQHLVEVVS